MELCVVNIHIRVRS